MSTCDEVGSDVHTLIKELAIRRVEHRSKTNSNEFHHLVEGVEVACLRRRFFFVLQQVLSFHSRHHLCRQGVALACTRQLCLQGPVSVHAHRTKGVTESEEREGANGVGGGIGVGGGNGDENGGRGWYGDVNGDGDVDGAGAGTTMASEVEANEGAKDGIGAGSGDGAGTGAGVETRRRTQDGNEDGNESSSGDGNADEDGNRDGNEGGIVEGGGEAKKRKKPHKTCRRDPALLFRTRHHFCRQRVVLTGTRQLRSQSLVPVHAHRTERVSN